MSYSDTIKGVLLPKIATKEISVSDTGSVTSENIQYKQQGDTGAPEDKQGSDAPLVFVNKISITPQYLCIDETGYLPRIKLIFKDPSGALTGPNYPKKDPILSVYIKSGNPKLKPIACDWLITNIKTSLDEVLDVDDPEGLTIFTVTGELFIPKIYDNKSTAYPNLSSKDALEKLAGDLDLGYAINNVSTDDSMTWINTNRNSLDFIRHISMHSYLNEDSFFNSFIDKYYYLNFINVSEQMKGGHDLNLTYDNQVDSSEFSKSSAMKNADSTDTSEQLSAMMLTNKPSNKGKPDFIIKYSLQGSNGRVLKTKGYRKKIYYYDHTLDSDDKFTSFYMSPLRTSGDNDDLALIPENEFLKDSMIKKWMNIDYGNNHREYNAAALINNHNINELNKIKFKVETAGINFQVVRGAALPVAIYQPSLAAQQREAKTEKIIEEEKKLTEGGLETDDVLSGRYYVMGTRYIYDELNGAFPFKTEFTLGRVEWLGENNI